MKSVLMFGLFAVACGHGMAYKFHETLTPEERLHYFGTELIDEVPAYEYTSPQPIDRRRRDTDGSSQLVYVMEAFGERLHLSLQRNVDLISPGCIVQHLKKNGSNSVYPCAANEIGCFYTGYSSNHSDSWAALSLCGGVNGIIGTPEKTLVVQPIMERHRSRVRRDTSLATPHIIHRYTRNRHAFDVADPYVENSRRHTSRRRRRSAGSKRYVETTVVADHTVYNFHGQGTEKFVKTVMNIVADRFLDPSLQTPLYFTLTKLMILEHDQAGLEIEADSTKTLNSFCDWQSGWNPDQDTKPEHADYVTLITKVNLEHLGNPANSGLARKGMCGLKTKCSVNEDSGLGSGLTIAHETGHVLGMNHDHDGNACADYKNIMASMSGSGPDALKWSTCSANALKTFLSSSESGCLDDEPATTAEKLYGVATKPGITYTANHQCKLLMGPNAEICEGVHRNNMDVCGSIACRPKPALGVEGCVIQAAPRMDGTECGGRKWCIQGTCVAMGAGSPGPINGGWSLWESKYSDCSRSCGGGVKVKRRFCNNPEARYGGQPCVGSDVTAEICNIHSCATSQLQFMEEQCSATDGKEIQGHLYQWVPDTGAIGDDSCKISCQADGTNWYGKRGVNTDGTDCFTDTPATFTKCVTGQCKQFGCDGHMDSGHVFDKCGVCNGGGNTCRKLSGTFHAGKGQEFTTVVRIPTRSTGITVTQGNMYCYISVKVGNQHLFSEMSPPMSGTYTLGGVTIRYNKKPERVDIVGPITVGVDAEVYRKYGAGYVGVDPDVYYEYHVPTGRAQSSEYLWKTQAGKCSRDCGTGTQTPTITCVNGNSGVVADYFCNINEKPRETAQTCNTHACPPRWRTSAWQTCSSTCGGGVKHRTVECVEENSNVELVLADARCHGQAKPSATSTCNTNQCPGTWRAGGWSTCSESCSQGIKSREVKCYSTASSSYINDSRCPSGEKPATSEYCVLKPCRTDIKGAACVDGKGDCLAAYGDNVCQEYKSYSMTNCMKSCGVCVENPIGCDNLDDTCEARGTAVCTAYPAWSRANCQLMCDVCPLSELTTTTTTTTAAPPTDTCSNADDTCDRRGKAVCTAYPGWSKTNCQKLCGFCHSSVADCKDKLDNCQQYQADMCKTYGPWATANCQAFCGLCGSRKKRDLTGIEPPQMKSAILVPPPLQDQFIKQDDDNGISIADASVDEKIDEAIPASDNNYLNPAIPDVNTKEINAPISGASIDPTNDVMSPSMPVCNTLRTAPSGSVDTRGKMLPGTTCEQIIALPLTNKVLLKFQKMDINCDEGDEFLITDGMTNREVPVCSSVLGNEWLSSGSVVVLRFRAGVEGHGYSLVYEAYPRNTTMSACNQHLTATFGDIHGVALPATSGGTAAAETCEIYITTAPNKRVQLRFGTFIMAGAAGSCEQHDGILVADLEGGEVDMMCGELSPFLWESRGPRVKISYKQTGDKQTFSATYSSQEI